ncbi:DUF4406 domain-containing protein [Clostridium cochlearium]|jgi:hypothetical protein|uniref:DUF7768 domain-containing protein n=1 Tax=Clostridium cochlearium TaxID=1494 RepID=UPI000BBC2541|nr:DUF4406 domain-containing protein [Clostridium cochlearium]
MNKYNPEGYLDLTPYYALSKIRSEGFRPLVYICSPYRGDTEENVKNARAFSRFAVDKNAIPFAPHLLFPQFMDDDKERDLAMFMNSIFLKKCQEIWVLDEYISEGMREEIKLAEKYRKTIRYFTLEEVLN